MVQAIDPFLRRGIYPPHSYPKLKDMPTRVIKEIEKNLKYLEETVER